MWLRLALVTSLFCFVSADYESSLAALKAMRWTITQPLGIPGFSEPPQSIAYLKPHKVGSSTVAGVFHRYAARRNLSCFQPGVGHALEREFERFVRLGKQEYAKTLGGEKSFLAAQHIAREGACRLCSPQLMKEWYETILQETPTFLTTFRFPETRVISYIGYFRLPSLSEDSAIKNAIKHYLSMAMKRTSDMPMQIDDFGFYPEKNQLGSKDAVYKQRAHEILQAFPIVLLTESTSESLVYLAVKWNWTLWDIANIPLHIYTPGEKHPRGGKRPSVKNTIHDSDVKKMIDMAVLPDKPLYSLASKRLEEQIASIPMGVFISTLSNYYTMQRLLDDVCRHSPEKTAENNFCRWLTREDTEIDSDTMSSGKSFVGHASSVSFPGIDY